MKSLLVAIVVLGLATMSCTKSRDSLSQTNDSEIQSRKGGGGNNSGGGVSTSVPQVTGLSATAISPTQVSLKWNSVTNATSYWIYRDNIVLAIVQSTSFVDAYVTSGSTHTYAVAAVVNSTLGPKSASVTVTTP